MRRVLGLEIFFMRGRWWAWIGITVLLIGGSQWLVAQQTGVPASKATITFTIDFPQSNPKHYAISVDAGGHASYECTGKVADDGEVEEYRSEFEMSAANRERIFDWAKQTRYFLGNIDSGNRKLAFTGDKTLSYRDGERTSEGRFNYSNSEPVRQLTTLFQNIAATQEYGHRLVYYHRYQKLALDAELKEMEAQARSNELSEIQSLAPVLQEIAEDASVMNGVRARARELSQMTSNAPAGR